uniref:40S ribosomal protein S8 n=1 Tax=Cryptomonas curvata TaxID=233186 RepID=A0A7S0QGY9_9CRYP|nr:40S ribosomal protein S8 [Cryptomonas curvata]|mmetsp:Transcript_23146/g.48491  ORF Transcript_23146/g.48491 Transcript_23146/m.48491 type:complete len:195 (+) Transcript_23146:149-733(+)
MGITRDKYHKKRLTGGKQHQWRKKRKHELGRQSANTKIGAKHITIIRVRGGNFKKRALSLESGNFSWISYGLTKKTKIISVMYNASNNEFVRTNTLVKSSIIYIDATPFKNLLLKKKSNEFDGKKIISKSRELNSLLNLNANHIMEEQIKSGRLLARICSRPGQTGRADGYIIEGSELEFYQKKIQKKKSSFIE